MKKILLLSTLLLSYIMGYSQLSEASKPYIIDTLQKADKSVVLFSDNTWQYLDDLSFEGILNKSLHAEIEGDSSIKLKTYWDNNTCFSNQNNNFLICVVDSLHPNFAIPVKGVLTSAYKYRSGRWHHGVDLDLRTGDTVVSAFSGKVRYAKYNTHGYGNLVIVRHHNGLETYYAHLSKLLVTPNQYVVSGQTLGLGGATGRAYGAHLHFETRFYDSSINPEEIFDFENKKLKDSNLIVHNGLFQNNKSSGSKVVQMRTANSSSNTYAKGKYHRIRSGDSLWKISRMYGTSVSRLCQLNGISESTTLRIGKTLKVS